MSENRVSPGDASARELAARIELLERENADLRSRAAAVEAGAEVPGRPRRHVGRAFASTLLVVLGLVLAPVAVVAAWAERELTDTDRYVETIGPLAEDPAIQSAVQNRLTAVVMERAEVDALVEDALTAIADQGLPPRIAVALGSLQEPLTNGIESFVHDAAGRVVQSDAFSTAWVEANRLAHEQMVAVMSGEDASTLQIGDEGQLTIELSGLIERLKEQLVASGFEVAANIPEVNASFTIVESSQLVRVQNAYGLVRALGTWLPWLSLGLIAAGVLTATRRSRALVVAGCGLALSMLVLGIGLAVARSLYLDALTGTVERLDAAEVVFDQVVWFIRVALRTVAVAGLVVAAAAYFGGGSESARRMRAEIGRGMASARTWGEQRGVSSGPVGTWLGAHKGFVRAVLLSLGGLAILLARSPTPGLVVTVAVVVAVLVALLELVARPPSAPVPVPVPVPERAPVP